MENLDFFFEKNVCLYLHFSLTYYNKPIIFFLKNIKFQWNRHVFAILNVLRYIVQVLDIFLN